MNVPAATELRLHLPFVVSVVDYTNTESGYKLRFAHWTYRVLEYRKFTGARQSALPELISLGPS
jgi:hypothetical protein